MLLRLGEVIEWTGMSEKTILKAVDAGSLKRIRVHDKARGLYNKDDIKALIGL